MQILKNLHSIEHSNSTSRNISESNNSTYRRNYIHGALH